MTDEQKSIILSIAESNNHHVSACAIDFLNLEFDPEFSEFISDQNIVIDEDHTYDNMKLLSKEEEMYLLPLAQAGNKEAMETIFKKLESFVNMWVNKILFYQVGNTRKQMAEDLKQDIYVLLLQIIKTYEPQKDKLSLVGYFDKIIRLNMMELRKHANTNIDHEFSMTNRDHFINTLIKIYIRDHQNTYNTSPSINDVMNFLDEQNYYYVKTYYKSKSPEEKEKMVKHFMGMYMAVLKSDPLISEAPEFRRAQTAIDDVEFFETFPAFVNTLTAEERKLIQIRTNPSCNLQQDMQDLADELGHSLNYVYKLRKKILKKYNEFVA